jgi:hypothetical protein
VRQPLLISLSYMTLRYIDFCLRSEARKAYNYCVDQISMSQFLQPVSLASILFLFLLPLAAAQNATCNVDQGSTRPGGGFDAPSWLRRGICVRNVETYAACRSNLQIVLSSLDSLHAAEYSAAATVLALLPTVGSLFGTQLQRCGCCSQYFLSVAA